LLKSTRQQNHQRIAQVLAEGFPEIVETQSELLAHHYTEAGLTEQAIVYWQRAGEHAVARSAHLEAIAHFIKGLETLLALPDSTKRPEHELSPQLAMGRSWMATTGYAAPEVERIYARARELCRHVENTPRLLQVLLGLVTFYFVRGAFQTSRELGEKCLNLEQRLRDTVRLQQTIRCGPGGSPPPCWP
jgi:predicted ATPase